MTMFHRSRRIYQFRCRSKIFVTFIIFISLAGSIRFRAVINMKLPIFSHSPPADTILRALRRRPLLLTFIQSFRQEHASI